ncbi:MAG: hypothetical protein ACPGRG_04735 [Marinomonas sp.]|uniref:DUF904 domain-containing protein n=1 Tax=Marinomonas pontica TaxID=264739 RepID=A0ABM8F946_9GAMM|nr:hypothetical protein [Marinomonas pontica]MCW8357565.1 hypothetical protein [Marinomonas pontica]BDX01513.1 hypothetical protein MACH16_02610 [Marinomonas pontica]
MNRKDNSIARLVNLLEDLEKVSLQDIAQIPSSQQHILAEKIESLQDELKALMKDDEHTTH